MPTVVAIAKEAKRPLAIAYYCCWLLKGDAIKFAMYARHSIFHLLLHGVSL